jgi:peptidoglycan/xylan/chitin deacetylase (PgdA/CDA1 family)
MSVDVGFDPGTFVLTLDTELIWGSFDSLTAAAFARQFPDERSTILALLDLLDRYEIPATWAVLGHLFLRECQRVEGIAHPELCQPRQSWYHADWLAADPCTDRLRDPLWYGDDILDAIQAADTPQEIGSHSFSHVLYDDPALTEAAVHADLQACVDLAARRGIELRSFVFPRNREAHHQALRDAGFTAYRAVDPTWYARLPESMRRPAHLADQMAGVTPPTSRPSERLPGLWSIPGSMMLIHRSGVRRAIPIATRVRKARRGLQRASQGGGVFHLWTHPFNVANDPGRLLGALEAVLQDATRLRDAGKLRIETMGGIAGRMAAAAQRPPRTALSPQRASR